MKTQWTLTVLAVAGTFLLSNLEAPAQTLFRAKVNFQPSTSATPAGYLSDSGAVFGNRGNGYSYGWNASNSANTRERNATADQRYDTLIHMQNNGSFTWEIAVPRGTYTVKFIAGDPSFTNSFYDINVEGVSAINGSPTEDNPCPWLEGFQVVLVHDGRLTISNGTDGINNKLCFIEIVQHWSAHVNFQPSGTPVPAGWVADTGATYGSRPSGHTYGWNLNNSANTRDRNLLPDQLFDTLTHLQQNGNFSWKIAVPSPGNFTTRIVAGDPGYFNSVYSIDANGVHFIRFTPSSTERFAEQFISFPIASGTLTVNNGTGAVNNKLSFIEIFKQEPPAFDTLFQDIFNRTAGNLGPDWNQIGVWTVANSVASNTERGYALMQTAQFFPHQTYEIECRANGFGVTQGPSPADAVGLIFGGQDGGPNPSWNFYRVRYFPDPGEFTLERVQTPIGGEITVDYLARAPGFDLPDTDWVRWKVQHDSLGFIKFFVDTGSGYPATPILETRDTHFPTLGHFGWVLESEAPLPFNVDWISAR